MKPYCPSKSLGLVIQMTLLLGAMEGRASPLGAARRVACAPGRSDIAATLIDQRVWTTQDGGKHWQLVNSAEERRSREEEDVTLDSEALLGREPRLDWRDAEAALDLSVAEGDNAVSATEITGGTGRESHAPLLAISDEGIVAVGVTQGIVILNAFRGVSRRIPVQNPRDLLFDRGGGLWVITDKELLHYDTIVSRSGPAGRWSLSDPVDMAPWRPGGEPAVLDHRGAWSAPPAGRGGLALIYRLAGGDAMAVANTSEPGEAAQSDRTLYVSARRRVFRIRQGKEPADLGAIVSPVEEMLVGEGERIRVRVPGGAWLEKDRDNLRPLKGISMAVDVLGRFWVGTESGPLSPWSDRGLAVRSFPFNAQGNPASFVYSPPEEWRAPPPCRRWPGDLLPAVRVFLGSGANGVHHRDIVELEDAGALDRGALWGVQLSWGIHPPDIVGCVQRMRRYHDDLQALRVRALGITLQQRELMEGERGPATLQEAIHQKMELMRLAQLLRVVGGGEPGKETMK